MRDDDKDDDDDLEIEEEENRYQEARNGDHLSGIPFQCDLCQFRNLNQRDPISSFGKDMNTLVAIRGANLDSFWGREPSTVTSNLRLIRQIHNVGRHNLSMEEGLPTMMPFPIKDIVGMGPAIILLEQSLRQGKYAKHLQYDSMRQSRTAFANFRASTGHVLNQSVMASDNRKLYITDCPTRSNWFERFMKGARLRMGMIRRKNMGLTSEMTHLLLDLMNEDWMKSRDTRSKKKIAEVAVYLLCTVCGGLRGEEVFLISLRGLITFWKRTQVKSTPHIMLTLLGRFKGETGERWHLMPIADETRTKMPVRKWFTRLLYSIVEIEKRKTGWLFTTNNRRGKMADYDYLFGSYCVRLDELEPELFPPRTEITRDLSLWRSGRRGSNTEALNQELADVYIKLNNRWRSRERAKGAEPGLDMVSTYAQIDHCLKGLLKYSQVQ